MSPKESKSQLHLVPIPVDDHIASRTTSKPPPKKARVKPPAQWVLGPSIDPRSRPYVATPQWLACRDELSSSALKVYGELSRWLNSTNQSEASVMHIAFNTGFSQRQTIKLIAELKSWGLISSRNRSRGVGGTNVYTFHDHPWAQEWEAKSEERGARRTLRGVKLRSVDVPYKAPSQVPCKAHGNVPYKAPGTCLTRHPFNEHSLTNTVNEHNYDPGDSASLRSASPGQPSGDSNPKMRFMKTNSEKIPPKDELDPDAEVAVDHVVANETSDRLILLRAAASAGAAKAQVQHTANQSKNAVRRFRALWETEFSDACPDAGGAPKWGIKDRKILQVLINRHGEQELTSAAEYMFQTWSQLRVERWYCRKLVVPTFQMFCMHLPDFLPEATIWLKYRKVVEDYNAFGDKYVRRSPEMTSEYTHAVTELAKLGIKV